jgi:hypothetical protein
MRQKALGFRGAIDSNLRNIGGFLKPNVLKPGYGRPRISKQDDPTFQDRYSPWSF